MMQVVRLPVAITNELDICILFVGTLFARLFLMVGWAFRG